MGPLCTGKRSRWRRMSREGHVSRSDIDPLGAKEVHQRPPMGATLPVSPQHGIRSNKRLGCFVERGGPALWVQHCTDAPWFPGGCPVPLAALSEWTGTTMANASGIHDSQRPIPLWAAFLGVEGMVGSNLDQEDGILTTSTTYPFEPHFCVVESHKQMCSTT